MTSTTTATTTTATILLRRYSSNLEDPDNDDEEVDNSRSTKTTTTSRDVMNHDPNVQKDDGLLLLRRFTNPIIDDVGLPLTDASFVQIVAPSLQVFWIGLVQAPRPSWLQPILINQLWEAKGSLLAPTLLHGAGLACCWLGGALAARAYERRAIDPTVEGYGTIVWTILKAGAFASGLLIFSTQLDLFIEFGGRYVQPGESEEIDLRLLTAWVEVLNDIIFEASTLMTMRLFLAWETARNTNNQQ